MDRVLVAFGIFALIVGVGSGYFMYTYPEGLNPDWPMGMAMLAPAVFALGGLHVIAAGLHQTRLSNLMLRAIIVCFFAIVNWAAFFTTHIQCRVTISFLGAAIVGWNPSEAECRNSLRALVAILDVLVIISVGFFASHRYRRYRTPRKEPGP